MSATLRGDQGQAIGQFTSQRYTGDAAGVQIQMGFQDASYPESTIYSIGFSSQHPSPALNPTGISVRTRTRSGFVSNVDFVYFPTTGRWIASSLLLSVRLEAITMTIG